MVSSPVSTRAGLALAALLCCFLSACSSSPKGPAAAMPRFGAVAVDGDAKSLVGVWSIDIEATMKAIGGEAEPPGVREKLGQMSTQLGLFEDGVFILKNLGRDARGMVTVEGTWSFDGQYISLVGHLENGQAPAIRKNVRYRVDQNRLVREREVEDVPEKRVVYAVLRKAFDA